jgi:uncharacterized membrane protein (UPF0127 family)
MNLKIYFIGNVPIILQKLETPEEKQIGFMFKTSKPSDDFGLLFANNFAYKQSFWMKNVFFDLDLLGFDENDKLVEIIRLFAEDEIPKTFTNCVKNVVEVRAGWVDDFLVKIGDELVEIF